MKQETVVATCGLLWGLVIGIIGIYGVHSIFKKDCRIVWMMRIGIICPIFILGLLMIPNPIALFPAFILTFICYMVLYYLYWLRIKSLGQVQSGLERCVIYIPIGLIVCLLTPMAAYILTTINHSYYTFYNWSSTVIWVILLLAESFCFFILVRKLLFMLEFRVNLQKVLLLQTSACYLIACMGHVGIYLMKYYAPYAEVMLWAIMLELRVLFVVDFYRYLISELVGEELCMKSMKYHSLLEKSYMTDLESS